MEISSVTDEETDVVKQEVMWDVDGKMQMRNNKKNNLENSLFYVLQLQKHTSLHLQFNRLAPALELQQHIHHVSLFISAEQKWECSDSTCSLSLLSRAAGWRGTSMISPCSLTTPSFTGPLRNHPWGIAPETQPLRNGPWDTAHGEWPPTKGLRGMAPETRLLRHSARGMAPKERPYQVKHGWSSAQIPGVQGACRATDCHAPH